MTKIKMTAMAALLALISSPVTASDGATTFADWDLNGDGEVTLAEARDSLANTFLYFDLNNDGYLDELDVAVEDEDAVDGDYQVEFSDDNLDERVSLAEFTERAAEWVTAMDRNGDGIVTLDDFGGTGFN